MAKKDGSTVSQGLVFESLTFTRLIAAGLFGIGVVRATVSAISKQLMG